MSDQDDSTPTTPEPVTPGTEPEATHRSPRVDALHALPLTPTRVEQRRLASAARDVIEVMTSTSASPEELSDAADLLEDVARKLATFERGKDYSGVAEMANAGDILRKRRENHVEGDPESFAEFDHSPFIGLANPMSPPVYMDYKLDSVHATVRFGSAYEGPPSSVHGGYVAGVFDELLGATQSLSGSQGMTANLSVDYRSPTPLHTDLVLKGWLDRVDGRKIWVKGSLHAGETLCAEAQGLFISFDATKFLKLLELRETQTRRPMGG